MSKGHQVLPKYLYCLSFTFSIIAVVLLFIGTTCNFVQFKSTTPIAPTAENSENIVLEFGLYYYRPWDLSRDNSTLSSPATDSCEMYSATLDIDSTWRAARVFMVTAVILGGSIIFMDIFNGCLSMKRDQSYTQGVVLYAICCLCSGLSLMLLNSKLCQANDVVNELNKSMTGITFEETCTISQGGKATIASCVLWLVCAVMAVVLHPSPKKENTLDSLDEPFIPTPTFISEEGTPRNVI